MSGPSISGGWIRYYGGDLPQHLIPLGDLIEHAQSPDCACRPNALLDRSVFVHHAADGREYQESDMRPELQERPQ